MADSPTTPDASSPEEIALKLLYLVSWSENIDLEGWGKTDRAWILDTYAQCLLTVQNPAGRAARSAERTPAPPAA